MLSALLRFFVIEATQAKSHVDSQTINYLQIKSVSYLQQQKQQIHSQTGSQTVNNTKK